MDSEAVSTFQLRLDQCNQLLMSASEHMEQAQFGQAIEECTKIIMLVPHWYEDADKSGIPAEFLGLYINALQLAYVGRADSYLSIGEKEKYDADFKMSQELLNGKYPPSQNVSPDFSTVTLTKKFPSATGVNEYQELADEAIASGNYEAAIIYCDKILEREPRNWSTMLNKAMAIGFLATPENSRGTLAGDNEDSFLSKSLTWFQKAETTVLDYVNEMISSGKEPDFDLDLWLSTVVQNLRNALELVATRFELKIMNKSSTQEKFLAWTELIPVYIHLLYFNLNNEDDVVKAEIRDSAQRFRNKFRTFFESPDAYDLIMEYLPEVRGCLHALNIAETILKSFNPNYKSILVSMNNSTLIELDAGLVAQFDDYKSLVPQNSPNASQGSGCLGVIVCVIIVAYSLIA